MVLELACANAAKPDRKCPEPSYRILAITQPRKRHRSSHQATSNGLLEVTALISGQHRKFNVPGARATARKSKNAATANSFTTNAGTGAPTLGMYISRGSSTAGGTTNSISRYRYEQMCLRFRLV